MSLVERFRHAYGKSQRGLTYDGPLLLHDHVMDVTRVIAHVLRNSRPTDYPAKKADVLVLAGYLHDVGKLNEHFKEMLYRVHHRQSLDGLPRIKHEASTFEFLPVTIDDLDEVAATIADETGYHIDQAHLRDEAVMGDVWAHAVTHHGLFYVSTESHKGQVRPCIRRQWTTFYAGELSRLTLADLLFEYHPLGGLVIVGDIVASAWHGMGRPIKEALQQYVTLEQFINLVQQPAVLEEATAQQRADERRDTHLADMIGLLLGGVN